MHAGERGEFNGTGDNVNYFVGAAPEPDEFDQWANDLDLKEDNSISGRYVSREVPGYSDLDDNGSWNEEPDYGPVWYPSQVPVGWVPYRYGQWVWVTPWGGTWIDDARWGYAPFHYGRWVTWKNNWCWVPAPKHGRSGRAVYAPALVGWVSDPAAIVTGALAVVSP